MSKFNEKKMALLISVIALGFGAALPAESKTLNCDQQRVAREVRAFIENDFAGARLASEFKAEDESCLVIEENTGWDKFEIVKSFTLNPCHQTKNPCFKAEYAVVAVVFSGSPAKLFPKGKKTKATLNLTKNHKGAYNVNGLDDLPPQVGVEAARKHLNSLVGENSDSSPWARQVLEQIKAL